MIHLKLLGGSEIMDSNAITLFGQVVAAGIPYAITWRVGMWVVNTLLDWVTGSNDRI